MRIFIYCTAAALALNAMAIGYSQTAPQIVTLANGTQYFGRVATVSEYSSEVPKEWNNAQQIALVDDGLRRLFFNRGSVANLAPLDENHPIANPITFDIPQRVFAGKSRGYGNLRVGPFDEHGHRKVQSSSSEGSTTFIQGITRITPYWCELQTLANPAGDKLRDWTMRIATSTVPPAVLRNLLIRQIEDRDNPADFLSIVDFFKESEQYKEALDELSFVAERFPDLSERIEQEQAVIRQARARRWIRQVRERIEVGQPQLAAAMLRAFDRSGIAGEILAEMAELQNELEGADSIVAKIRKPIFTLIDELLAGSSAEPLPEPAQLPLIERFKQELNAELNLENAPRLDAFLRFSGDPQMNQLQKLSLAISGWMLGSNNATENFAVSQSFFTVRQLIVEYLSSADANRRREILDELRQYEGGEPEYLAALIAQMKPVSPPDLRDVDPSRPLRFELEIPGTPANAEPQRFQYFVQLPPEYNPYRRYPCVVTLPGDRDVDQQLLRWCGPFNETLGIRVGQAMKNGYIVVCVDWKRSGQFDYGYSAREHLTILTAFRDALRRFSIDTDRVYLAGHGFGADAAYDIGIAHPEHWAGVIGISGKIDRYPMLYKRNEHVALPIYSVVGEKDINSRKSSEDAWNSWLPSRNSAFDCTVVEYIGRSNEPFSEEIVEAFKWMRGHRRRLPDRTGFDFKCDIRRPWDNYFWFFELHGIPADKVVWPEFFGQRHPRPLEISGSLKSRGNVFFLGPSNQGTGGTLWLSPEFVDFANKIVIDGRGQFKDYVSPSRTILLEDVRTRSDRQHPYWANLHCEGKKWTPNVVE